MERFGCKTELVAGDGALCALGELGAKRVFCVTDPYFAQNGTAARLLSLCAGAQTEIFDAVEPDPSVELAAQGTARARAFRPDWIVALGGGSAIDCAKAVAYFSGCGAKLAAVPTTSGSGSEVTDFAILTCGQVKRPLVDAKLRPSMAILDGELLTSLPRTLIADGGFDVLSHCAEAFVAKNAGAVTDALAADAFCAAYANLPASYAGRAEVRMRVHVASTMAGMAFSDAGLGLCHAVSHSIGGLFHIPHGRINAILLPPVIELNAYAAAGKYAKLSRSAGLGGSADSLAVRNLKNGLIRLRRELNLPATLTEAGIPAAEVRRHAGEIVNAALSDPCCATNPVKVEDFMVRRLLEEVTGRA